MVAESSGNSPVAEDTGRTDLRALWVLVNRRRWLVLTTLVLFVAAIMAYVLRQPAIYSASATVIVDDAAPQVLGREVQDVVDLGSGAGYFDARAYMQTQYRILRSNALASRVVEQLKLNENTDFTAPGPGKPGKMISPDDAVPLLLSMIQVQPLQDTRVLVLAVEHWQPALAARLVNTVAKEYIAFNLDQKVSVTSSAVAWLTTHLDEVQKKLQETEEHLHQFKDDNQILSVSLEDSQNLAMGQIKYLNEKLTETQAKRISLGARMRAYLAVRAGGDIDSSFPELADEGSLSEFRTSLNAERKKLIELKERYQEKHPAVEAQDAKTKATEKTLRREIENRIDSVEAEFRMVVDTEKELSKALGTAKAQAITLNKKEIDFNRLRRENENTAKVYSLLLSRLKESEISGQVRANNIRLLDAASEPHSPVRPRKTIALILALIGGLGLGIILALIVDRFDDSIKSPEALETILHVPVLGVFPRIVADADQLAEGDPVGQNREPALHVHTKSNSTAAECLRSIRTNLLFASVTRPVRRLLITSAIPREGKTTIAISLGISLAQSGKRVIIVDADLRRPRVHEPFGLKRTSGLTNKLLAEASLDELVQKTEVQNLSVLPCGPLPPNPAELLHSKEFSDLLDELNGRYDLVIIDSPPVIAVADSLVVGKLCDGTIVVGRMRESSLATMRKAARHLHSIGVHLIGAVLNDVDLDRDRSYYGTYYYYNYSEGSGRNGSHKKRSTPDKTAPPTAGAGPTPPAVSS